MNTKAQCPLLGKQIIFVGVSYGASEVVLLLLFPYSGKFLRGANFADFTDRLVSAEIETMDVVTNCKKVSLQLELRSIEGTKLKP